VEPDEAAGLSNERMLHLRNRNPTVNPSRSTTLSELQCFAWCEASFERCNFDGEYPATPQSRNIRVTSANRSHPFIRIPQRESGSNITPIVPTPSPTAFTGNEQRDVPR
jgi:hypothetical protein